MLIAGVIGTAGGIGELVDASESRTYVTEQSSGTFTIDENESWTIDVYLIHPVDCDSLDITIVDSSGNNVLANQYAPCYEDDMIVEGDRQHYAYITHETAGMEYTLNSNVNIDVTGSYCDEACVLATAGGIFATFGGFMAICCAVPILILGIILGFTLDDNKSNSTMQSGQVMYQTPVTGQAPTGQVMYQTPVTGQAPMTQTFNQTPVEQASQPAAVPVTPITPPTAQQPSVEQASQPAAVPVTPITPPTAQQPSVEKDTQPEQAAWWGDETQQ